MDELSHVFDDDFNNNNKRTRSSRKVSMNERKRKSSSIESSDDGICMSTDSYNPLNDSIAQRIKKRNTYENSKQFDSGFFFDRVVDQIANKYKSNRNEDAIIDLENMEIVDKTGVMEKRIRTEIGYFAENTLEDLRKTSFRDKSLIRTPIVDSTPDVSHSTPKSTKANKADKRSLKTCDKSSKKMALKPNPTKTVSNYRNHLSNFVDKHSLQTRPQSLRSNIVSRNLMFTQECEESESEESDQSEELEDNHPLVRYESRQLWTDQDYQIECLRNTIEMLKNDESGHFRDSLRQQAVKTLNLPILPSGPNLIPRIIFNRKGEPNFEFYFRSMASPLDVTEELTHLNKELIDLTLIVYDLIRLKPTNRRTNGKQLNYPKRRQIKYK